MIASWTPVSFLDSVRRFYKVLAAALALHLSLLVFGSVWGLHACHEQGADFAHQCPPRAAYALEDRADCPDKDCLPESPLEHVIGAAVTRLIGNLAVTVFISNPPTPSLTTPQHSVILVLDHQHPANVTDDPCPYPLGARAPPTSIS